MVRVGELQSLAVLPNSNFRALVEIEGRGKIIRLDAIESPLGVASSGGKE